MCGPAPACGEIGWGTNMLRTCTREEWLAQGSIPPDLIQIIIIIIAIVGCVGLWIWILQKYIDGRL
jgi:hypothetical protein